MSESPTARSSPTFCTTAVEVGVTALKLRCLQNAKTIDTETSSTGTSQTSPHEERHPEDFDQSLALDDATWMIESRTAQFNNQTINQPITRLLKPDMTKYSDKIFALNIYQHTATIR